LEAFPLGGTLERCQSLREVFLHGPGGPEAENRPAEIESVWQHRGRWVFKFRGVDSIGEAEALAGAEVRIPASARPEAAPGEYYQTDLIGCEVSDARSGRRIGRVKGWREYGGPPLVEVEDEQGRPVLVPFARAIFVEIDLDRRRILVDLPEGLTDLDQS
jgi:16S rRNA processing protein RimM